MIINIPTNVKYIIDTLYANGFEGFIVGGSVRDQILNRNVDDFDITTNALPDDIKKIFKKTIDVGIKHGTVCVLLKDNQKICIYEITTYRIDGPYFDGRHPSVVEFSNNLYEDLSRRDFTINAMAYNDKVGLVDKFGGLLDLKNKIIRAVGDPIKRFKEDALRMLRAIRFASKLGFNIETKTYEAIKILAQNISKVSKERIQVELIKILISDYPENFDLIFKTQLSKYLCDYFDDIRINKYYKSNNKQLVISSLLYDMDDKQNIILKQLKFDNKTIEKVNIIVKYKYDLKKIIENKYDILLIKKLIFEIGYDNIYDLIKIYAFKNNIDLSKLYDIINNIEHNNEPIFLKDLNIDGNDIKEYIKEKNKIGIYLKQLLFMVHNDKNLNSKQKLLDILNNIIKE